MGKRTGLIATLTAGALGLFVFLTFAMPTTPTFYADVMPIIQENCQACHSPGGLNLGGMVAPMAFMTFEDVQAWAPAIAMAVEDGRMPPWHASPEHYGKFRNERVLAPEDRQTLLDWVAAGIPEGDSDDAPPPVTFTANETGWAIGEPDIIIQLPEPFLVGDDVEDLYIDFEVPITEEQLPEHRWVKAVEFRAGSSAVHHVIANPLGGIAPGYEPRIYDEGYGSLLREGTVVTFQMHYHKDSGEGTAVWDQTQAAVKFYEPGEVIEHIVESEPLGMFRFAIPPGDPSYTFETDYTLEKDVNVLSFNPHMHLRGKAAKYTATFPDGREEVLLEVPRYDFNWQHTYYLAEPIFMPEGTNVHLQLWWDNSVNNPANPDPDKEVRWGLPTTDEMGYGFMRVTEVEPRHIVVGEEIPSDLPTRRPIPGG